MALNKLKKWIGSMLFSAFMNEYNENMEAIEDKFGEVEGDIAGVVESGSNANGSWQKFADGTMKCWGGGNLSSINSAWGDIYLNTANEQTDHSFPVPFVGDKPRVFVSNYDGSIFLGFPYQITNSKFTPRGARGTTISSAKYSFEAIGRWKE